MSYLGATAAEKTGLKVGEEVLCVSLSASPQRSLRVGMMASSIICKPSEIVRAPKGVDLTRAAGFLGIMATAYYCLIKKAAMTKGQYLLVHSALGGVGQCALQLAQRLGVKVIASAGSPSRRCSSLTLFPYLTFTPNLLIRHFPSLPFPFPNPYPSSSA